MDPQPKVTLIQHLRQDKLIRTIVLISLTVVIVLSILTILILSGNSSFSVNNSPTETNTNQIPISYVTGQDLSVLTPLSGDTVNGGISVTGTSSLAVSNIKVDLFDDNNNLLAENFITTFQATPSGSYNNWSTILNIAHSPETFTGKIAAISLAPGSTWKSEVSINFKSLEAQDRLKILAPVDQQVISDQDILFKGEMKGFFEGVLNIRLKNSAGVVIFSDTIQSDGDNLTAFAPFSKIVTIPPTVDLSGKTYTVEFYDVSAKDGSANVLLTLNLRK